jgi:hypothetical protein
MNRLLTSRIASIVAVASITMAACASDAGGNATGDTADTTSPAAATTPTSELGDENDNQNEPEAVASSTSTTLAPAPATTETTEPEPEPPVTEPVPEVEVTRIASLTSEPEAGLTESDYLTRSSDGDGQQVITYPLSTTLGIQARGVVLSEGPVFGREGVYIASADNSLALEGPEDEKIAMLSGVDFHNGIIEFEINAAVAPDTPEAGLGFARGFAGLCFRVEQEARSFECFYIRAENGPTDDPVRSAHAAQYISLPGFDFAALRAEAPEKYESAAPVKPGEWHTVRIEVNDALASLFIDGGDEAVLVVDDLKLGPDARGGIALWVGVFTDAFFRNATVTTTD